MQHNRLRKIPGASLKVLGAALLANFVLSNLMTLWAGLSWLRYTRSHPESNSVSLSGLTFWGEEKTWGQVFSDAIMTSLYAVLVHTVMFFILCLAWAISSRLFGRERHSHRFLLAHSTAFALLMGAWMALILGGPSPGTLLFLTSSTIIIIVLQALVTFYLVGFLMFRWSRKPRHQPTTTLETAT